MSKRQRLKKLVGSFSDLRIGIVGDLVVDTYIIGITERVSREAPVLVVRSQKEEFVPGGAANVASNLASLGAKVDVVGLVGKDHAGDRLKSKLRKSGLNTRGIFVDARYPTVSKTRILAGAKHTLAQQVLRLDREPGNSPSSTTMTKIIQYMKKINSRIDGWMLSDYGYRLMNDNLLSQMRKISADKPVLADSRFQIDRFTGLTAIKPNEQEALDISKVKANTRQSVLESAGILKGKVKSQAVIVTLGNQGMLVYLDADRYKFIPAVGTDKIVDLTGAGDTAGATLILSLSAGGDFYDSALLANCTPR